MKIYKLATLAMLISLMVGGYTASASLPTPDQTSSDQNKRYSSDIVVVTQPMTKNEFENILSSLEKYSSNAIKDHSGTSDKDSFEAIISQHSNDPLTREQAAKMIYDRLGLNQYTFMAENNFIDSDHIAFNQEVHALCTLGILDGYSDSSFRPNQVLSRTESAIIIDRLFSKGMLVKLNKESEYL